jgi:hypothetical protein
MANILSPKTPVIVWVAFLICIGFNLSAIYVLLHRQGTYKRAFAVDDSHFSKCYSSDNKRFLKHSKPT